MQGTQELALNRKFLSYGVAYYCLFPYHTYKLNPPPKLEAFYCKQYLLLVFNLDIKKTYEFLSLAKKLNQTQIQRKATLM